MFKLNKILKALVIAFMLLVTVPFVTLSATSTGGYDNSQFVSELTSEEKAAEELEKKEEDLVTYQAKIEARPEFKNFATYEPITTEDQFNAWEKGLYNKVSGNPFYKEEDKQEFYTLVLGDKLTPGLTDKLFEYSQMIENYRQNENIIVDASAAVEYMHTQSFPTPSVKNLDYIAQLTAILDQTQSLFKEVNPNTATEEEIIKAKESNVEFTGQINAITNVFEYYTMPKVPLVKRITHSPVMMNIAAVIAIAILFVVRFPVIKRQQEYAWNRFRPLSLLAIPIVGLVFFGFFSFMLSVTMSSTTGYEVYVNGESAVVSDRIYLNEIATYDLLLVANGSDNSSASTNLQINVTDNPAAAPTGDDPVTKQYGDLGTATFESESGQNIVNLQYTDDKFMYTTIRDALAPLGLMATDNFEPDDLIWPRYVTTRRDEFVLPQSIVLIWPSLLFGTLYFMFMMMPKPMVKMYLEELYTINKFCGFLAYNMAYRSNARVLIEETLQSIDAGKFAEDFAIIFFEKDRDMTDKIQDISQIYSYKFFEMYLGIVNIIFDEGVSDSTLKSLTIIQQFGDEYYNQADMFFKSKKGAQGSLMMIIGICMGMPLMVRKNTTDLFLVFANTETGYTFTIGCYLIWFGIICMINNMYKNNKIVRKEGRYA